MTRNPTLVKSKFNIEQHPKLEQQCLRATMALESGTVLARFDRSRRVDEPARYTVQRGQGEHLMLDPEYLQYANHSCDPNVFFDVDDMVVVSLRPIAAGEEIAFFYPSTEWSMAAPFDCACGTPRCLGHISGAKTLPSSVLARYRLSTFIRRMADLSLGARADELGQEAR